MSKNVIHTPRCKVSQWTGCKLKEDQRDGGENEGKRSFNYNESRTEESHTGRPRDVKITKPPSEKQPLHTWGFQKTCERPPVARSPSLNRLLAVSLILSQERRPVCRGDEETRIRVQICSQNISPRCLSTTAAVSFWRARLCNQPVLYESENPEHIYLLYI